MLESTTGAAATARAAATAMMYGRTILNVEQSPREDEDRQSSHDYCEHESGQSLGGQREHESDDALGGHALSSALRSARPLKATEVSLDERSPAAAIEKKFGQQTRDFDNIFSVQNKQGKAHEAQLFSEEVCQLQLNDRQMNHVLCERCDNDTSPLQSETWEHSFVHQASAKPTLQECSSVMDNISILMKLMQSQQEREHIFHQELEGLKARVLDIESNIENRVPKALQKLEILSDVSRSSSSSAREAREVADAALRVDEQKRPQAEALGAPRTEATASCAVQSKKFEDPAVALEFPHQFRLDRLEDRVADVEAVVIYMNRDRMAPRPEVTRQDIEIAVVEEFAFEPSVWECSVFIGLEHVRMRGTIFLFIALIANIAIQGLFILIIARAFPASPVNFDSLVQWRHVIGHHISQVDAFGHSLVSTVCESHSTLTVAFEQPRIFQDAALYIETDFFGPVLCMIVVMLQYMFWMRDTQRNLTSMKTFLCLPVSAKTCISKFNDDMLFLDSLNWTRKCFMYFVCLVRLIAATSLLATGTMWLVYTTSFTELVMNAVALQFLYDVDELLYDVLATPTAKLMLERTSIRTKYVANRLRSIGYNIICFFNMLSLFGFAVVIACVYVYPNASHLRRVLASTCGGNKDFTVAYHQDLDILLYAPTIPTSGENSRSYAIWKAIDEIVEGQTVHSAAAVLDAATIISLGSKDASEVADALMPSCRDSYPSDHPEFRRIVLEELKIENSSCEVMSKACGSPSLHLVRMLCPETCRCYYSKPATAISKGCPYFKCQVNAPTAGYYDASLSCTDDAASSLATSSHWQGYWNSLNASKLLQGSTNFDEVIDFAMNFGCAVISKYDLFEEFCDEVSDRHSLGTFCPEACDCRNQHLWGCPLHCYVKLKSTKAQQND